MFEFEMFSLALPLAYIIVLVGSLMTFSSIYRKRKAVQAATLAPWFPPHLQRNIYLSLTEGADNTDEKKAAPPAVIRAALIRRAVEDIRRIIQIRTAKQAISTLLARGSVGDDLWQRFLRAEKEMEEELRDVVIEANNIAKGWGQVIFQTANEIAANTEIRRKLEEIQDQKTAENQWWEKRRATIEAELMKEVDSAPAGDIKAAAPAPTVMADSTNKSKAAVKK